MADRYSKSDAYGRDSKYRQTGISNTRVDDPYTRGLRDTSHPAGGQMNDDYGFDWLESKEPRLDYDYNMDWDKFRDNRPGESRREYDNANRATNYKDRKVDLGITGNTRREEFAYSHRNYEETENPYLFNKLDKPGATRRDPLVYGSSNQEYVRDPVPRPHDDGMKWTHSTEYGGQDYTPGSYLGRTWKSVAADKDLMGSWHNMFGKIRTKWTGDYNTNEIGNSKRDDSISTDSYQSDRLSRNCKIVIVVMLILGLIAMAAVITAVLVLRDLSDSPPKDSDAKLVSYKYEATIANLTFTPDMADPTSESFLTIANDFCAQISPTTSSSDTNYEGCVVTEIKEGSVIVVFVIIINVSANTETPTSNAVLASIGIEINNNAPTNVGAFIVIQVNVGPSTNIGPGQVSPIPTPVGFGGSCNNRLKRCNTTRVTCTDNTCTCAVDKFYNEVNDSCDTNSYESDRLSRNCTIVIVVILILGLIAMAAVITAVLVLRDLSDSDSPPKYSDAKLVSYEYEATIANLTFTPDMADTTSESFLTIANDFCAQISPTASSPDTNYEGCVVTEIKEGSVIVVFIIVINVSANTETPTANAVLTLIGIEINNNAPTNVGAFTVTQVHVGPLTSIGPDQASPIPTLVNFSESCNNGLKRCKTTRVTCTDNTCTCATDKFYNEDNDSCDTITCTDIANITNGNRVYSGSSYGSQLSVECNEGYEWLSDVDIITCETRDSWKTLTDCTPIICETFSVPMHANVGTEAVSGRIFNDILQVSCDEGYNITAAFVICQSNRQWSDVPVCEIVQCGNIPSIANATIQDQTGTSYGDTATVVCAENYKLNGTGLMTCESSGMWTTNPTCVLKKCDALDLNDPSLIPNTVDASVVGTEFTFDCKVGYSLMGHNSLICQEDESWTNEPTCEIVDCDEPVKIINGSMIAKSGTIYNSSASYQCDAGYSMIGNSNITCQSDGTWNTPPTCELVDCDNLESPPNSKIESFTIVCDQGYEIDGTSSIVCMDNGQWNNYGECLPVSCGTISDIAHGTIQDQTGSSYGDTANVVCDQSYKLNGTGTINCDSSGMWTENPTCVLMECDAFEINDPNLIPKTVDLSPVGTELTFECKVGYSLIGNFSLICQEDESWTNEPTCEIVDCGEPDTVVSGTMIATSGTTYNSSASYQCDAGYSVIGGSNITCQSDGTWSTSPTCEPVDCGNLEPPPNSNIESFTIVCDQGYEIDGNSSIVCMDNGQWNNYGECLPVSCGTISDIAHGSIQDQTGSNYGDTANVVCDQSYKLNGTGTINCDSSGMWTENPTCVLMECDAFEINDPNLIPKTIDVSPVGTELTFECKVGYSLIGNNSLICQEDESWTNEPTCEIVDCGEPDTVVNGNVIATSGTTYNSSTSYKCDAGYSIIGNSNITCQSDGTWSSSPTCEPVDCGNLEPPLNSNIESFTIVCDQGYEIDGNSSIVCMNNGQWNDYGECLPVNCVPFPSPENSVSIGDSSNQYTFGDEVNVTCKAGFELSTILPATCNASGEWTNVSTCNPINCQSLPFPEFASESENTAFKFGDEVNIACVDGYFISNQSTVTCDTDGEWGTLPECLPIVCDTFPLPDNSTDLALEDIKFGEDVNITCQPGFELSGDSNVRCFSNGTWGSLPSCLPIVCSTIMLPSNANITNQAINGIAYGDEVELSCESGFELFGNSTISCDTNGNWDTANFPTCEPVDCDTFVLPENSFIDDKTMLKYGDEMILSCNDGYVLSDDYPITCNESGHWVDFPNCTPVECDMFNFTSNMILDGSSSNPQGQYIFNSTVSVACNEGFQLIGNSEIICLSNGSWSELPSCDTITCPEYSGTILYGEIVNITGNEYGDFVSILCDNNTIINVSCLSSSKWEPTPDCTIVTCQPYEVINGTVVIDGVESEPSVLPVGTSVQVECNTGFELVGNMDISNCTEDGTWSNKITCTSVMCSTNLTSYNTLIVVDSETEELPFESYLEVQCKDGLQFDDGSKSTNLTCTASGTWEGETMCRLGATIVLGEEINIIEKSTVASMYCNISNYESVHTVVIGKYNGTGQPLILYSIQNSASNVIPGYDINFTNTSTDAGLSILMEFSPVSDKHCGTYTCGVTVFDDNVEALDFKTDNASVEVIGYSSPALSISASSLTLGRDETFTCTSYTSDEPVDDNLHLEVKLDSETDFSISELSPSISTELLACHYSTSKIYSVSAANFESNITIRCRQELNGSVSYSEEAQIFTTYYICGDNEFIVPSNSRIVTTDDTSMLNVICDDGYFMEGDNMTQCLGGNWTEVGTCSPVSCPSFLAPDNSYDNITGTFVYSNEVNITCMPGFYISASDPAVCNATGEWVGIPSCLPIQCDPLPLPENATVGNQALDDIVFGEEVGISCEAGFELSGNSNVSCGTNGNWNTIEFPSCGPIDCESFTLPENSYIDNGTVMFKYGDKMVLSCVDGFVLTDNQTITCNETGHWVDFPNCAPVECEMFTLAPNMTLKESNTSPQDQYVFNATVFVECDIGFELIGDSEMTCLSTGSWSELPLCEITSCLQYNATIGSGEVVNSTGNQFDDIVTIQCDNSYVFEIRCMANGEWETPENCSQQTCEIFEVANGDFIGDQLLYPIGTSAEIECDVGFKINGNLSTTYCSENGTWSNNLSCDRVMCSTNLSAYNTLQTPSSIDPAFAYGANWTVDCVDGLTFYHGDSSSEMYCNANGTWEGEKECSIPGDVSIEYDAYSLRKNNNATVICNVSDWRSMQTISIGQTSEMNNTILYSLTNISGQVEPRQMTDSFKFSYTVDDYSHVSIEITFTPVTDESCGSYVCGVLVFDENYEIVDSKIARTNVTVADVRAPVISLSSLSVDRGEDVAVMCSGFIDKHMSDDELYIEVMYETNGSFAKINVSTESVFEVNGCQQATTKSYVIETNGLNEDIQLRCGIVFDGETLVSKPMVVNVSTGAYATFDNDSYTFNVGNNEVMVCDFYGENATFVTVYNSDKTHIVTVNATGQIVVENGTFAINGSGTLFGQTHTLVAVNVDLEQWCTKGGVIGQDDVTCEVYDDDGLITKSTASLSVSKLAGVPILEPSVEIVEGKDTKADRLFYCRGDIGNPRGLLEVESNMNGEYETFLTYSNNNTALGWIVNTDETTEGNECGTTATIGFALRNVSMAMHLVSLRCKTSPLEVTEESPVSEAKVMKVVRESYCAGVTSYTLKPHPYYCHSAVACIAPGLIDGVPNRCPSDNQCYDTTEGGSQGCDVSCEIVGCVFQPILCDRTDTWSVEGADVDFTCNIQDIGQPVSSVSLSANSFTIDALPTTLTAMDNVNITITDTQAVLSIENVTCGNEQNYEIIFNGEWHLTLQVSVESSPDVPSLTLPESLSANQEIEIVCNGTLGRDRNNEPIGSIKLESSDTGGMPYVVYNDDGTRARSEITDCQFIETVTYSVILNSDWNNTYIVCSTYSGSAVVVRSESRQILLGVPDIFCNPPLASSYEEGIVSFNCGLQDISDVTNIVVEKINTNDEVVDMLGETITSLPWNNTGAFYLSIPSSGELSLEFANVSCSQEGEYKITINNASSASVRLAVTSRSSVPMLNAQNTTRVDQEMTIECSAELGRDNNGDQVTELFIEVQFDNGTEFQVLSEGVETNVSPENCNYIGEVSLSVYADESWNNSIVRCVTKTGATIYNVSEEVTIEVEPSAITFTGENDVAIVGETFDMLCVVTGMTGITDIIINKDDGTSDIKLGDNVEILSNDISDDVANLTIRKTVQCGDDGVYYCRTKGSTVNLQKQINVTVEWKPTTPVIDLSVDIVEHSSPWGGFETLCSADIGFNNASIFFQSNKNGIFEDLDPSVEPVVVYNPSSCSNEKTIKFFTTYTSDWNETLFRCGVRDGNITLYDAEWIYVVPETLCDNKTTGTKLPHPFDCRGEFTCTNDAKKITPRKACNDVDSCNIHGTPTCVPCEDTGQCRVDPLDVTPYMECSTTTASIGQNVSIICNLHHISIDDISNATNVIISQDGIEIISTSVVSPTVVDSLATYEAPDDNTALLVTTTTISIQWTSLVCDDDGDYVVEFDNGTSQVNTLQHLTVYSTPETPTLSKTPDKYYIGVTSTIMCSGATGRPAGTIELMYRQNASVNFQVIQNNASVNTEPENCTFLAELSYSFGVKENNAGNEYKCVSYGNDGSVFESTVEEVVVEESDVYFVDDRITSPVGETFSLQCVFKNGYGASGAIISLRTVGGTTTEVCTVDETMNVTSQNGFAATVDNGGNNMTINIEAIGDCEHEGTFQCYSPSQREIKATSQMSVTRQNTAPILNVEPVFSGDLVYQGRFDCKSDLGYPSSTRVLKIQRDSTGDSNFEDYKTGLASGNCAAEETKVTVSNVRFNIADNGTAFRCVIHDTATNEIISETNSTQLIVLENNCPTNTTDEVYLPHPLKCESYLQCYDAGTRVRIEPCQGNQCFNPSYTSSLDLCGECTLLCNNMT